MGTKGSVQPKDRAEPDARLTDATARYEQALDRLIAQRREPPREVLDDLARAEAELWRHQLQAKRWKARLRERVAEGARAAAI
jgi:hypothetical protein